jgi:copper chaperone NosL
MIENRKYMKALSITLLALLVALTTMAADENMLKPSARDKCPVCGMFVARYPDWIAVILFRDGSRAFFDGPKDMFKYYFDMKHYVPSKSPSDIEALRVVDYYLLTPIDGRNAYYVIGSDVFGPMGRELIPFEKESDAKEFLKDHKGKGILRFKEVTRVIVKGLDQ